MIKIRESDPHEGTLRDLAPDLTPMIDILFILLVFFMLTAGIFSQSLELNLPKSTSDSLSNIENTKNITIEVTNSEYQIDGKKFANLDELKTAITLLKQSNPTHSFIIAGDKNLKIERLLNILTFMQSQGIEAANILMQKQK